jgi:hypothetical protein
MNKIKLLLVFAGACFSIAFSHAAVFKIINRTAGGANPNGSRLKVRPVWNGSNAGFVDLMPSQETGAYDTGFNNLTAVIYEEQLPQNADQQRDAIFCTRRYKAPFDINAWAVGGKIYIQSNADVAFSFDTIAGSGTVKALPYKD